MKSLIHLINKLAKVEVNEGGPFDDETRIINYILPESINTKFDIDNDQFTLINIYNEINHELNTDAWTLNFNTQKKLNFPIVIASNFYDIIQRDIIDYQGYIKSKKILSKLLIHLIMYWIKNNNPLSFDENNLNELNNHSKNTLIKNINLNQVKLLEKLDYGESFFIDFDIYKNTFKILFAFIISRKDGVIIEFELIIDKHGNYIIVNDPHTDYNEHILIQVEKIINNMNLYLI